MIRRIALLCVVLAAPAFGQTTVNGAGATFPNPMYQKWFSEYHKAHPDIQFNYQSIGSGGGIRQVLAQTVDFGASDGPMTDQQLAEAKTKTLTSRLKELGLPQAPILLVVSERSPGLDRAARNVPWLSVETPMHASVYQVLRNERVLFERAALLSMQEALA